MIRTILTTCAVLMLATSAYAQPRLDDYNEGWPYYRAAVVDQVVNEVSDLARVGVTAAERTLLRERAKLALEGYQLRWEQSPRRAWAALPRSRQSVPGLALSTAYQPADFNDYYAFETAVNAEERAALEELHASYMRSQPNAQAVVRRQLALSRQIYDKAWQLNRRTAWSALDLDRVIRALEELRRRRTHPVSPTERVVVHHLPGNRYLPLRALPKSGAREIGRAYSNDAFEVLQREDRWILVRSIDGREGWANSFFLKPALTQPAHVVTGPVVTPRKNRRRTITLGHDGMAIRMELY